MTASSSSKNAITITTEMYDDQHALAVKKKRIAFRLSSTQFTVSQSNTVGLDLHTACAARSFARRQFASTMKATAVPSSHNSNDDLPALHTRTNIVT
jgi:hypothetical protein